MLPSRWQLLLFLVQMLSVLLLPTNCCTIPDNQGFEWTWSRKPFFPPSSFPLPRPPPPSLLVHHHLSVYHLDSTSPLCTLTVVHLHLLLHLFFLSVIISFHPHLHFFLVYHHSLPLPPPLCTTPFVSIISMHHHCSTFTTFNILLFPPPPLSSSLYVLHLHLLHLPHHAPQPLLLSSSSPQSPSHHFSLVAFHGNDFLH